MTMRTMIYNDNADLMIIKHCKGIGVVTVCGHGEEHPFRTLYFITSSLNEKCFGIAMVFSGAMPLCSKLCKPDSAYFTDGHLGLSISCWLGELM